MIAPPQFLISLAQPWADFYADSTVAETIVTFGHVGALLFAGGAAIAADRMTLRESLRGSNGAAERARQLGELSRLHRVVISGIAVMVVTGVLMLAADLEIYYGSWVYWTKMALFVALLVNGRRMLGLEQALQRSVADSSTSADVPGAVVGSPAVPAPSPPPPPLPAEPSEWVRLRGAARTSLVLWFTITFFGILLVNAA
jgi:uncharacterized membrane protein